MGWGWRPDPADRRGVQVELTSAGRTAVDSAMEALLARERVILADLDTGDRGALADLLRRLVRPFDAPA